MISAVKSLFLNKYILSMKALFLSLLCTVAFASLAQRKIQKSLAKLILDYSESLLQIIFGLLLLSIYHPLFIIFGLILFVVLYLIFRFSFENGLKTSLKESKYKYKVAHWIQEIARNYFGFKNKYETEFALYKNDKLVNEYLHYRESHFEVIKKQFIQLSVLWVHLLMKLRKKSVVYHTK